MADSRVERIACHSHIDGLGLNADFSLNEESGLVGQEKARVALGLVHRLLNNHTLSGRAVMLSGPSGSGKTALALALSQHLGHNIPFISISAAEIYSPLISKTEALIQAFRRALGVKLIEQVTVIQGEVVSVQLDTFQNVAACGKLTLKTADMETIYDVGAKMVQLLQRENIRAGDVVQIDKANGKIIRLGRSYSRAKDVDAVAESVQYVATPSGELQRSEQKQHLVSLHDMDVINSQNHGFMALFSGETGEISPSVREQIDEKIQAWKTEGKADWCPGVLFIDDVHHLDLECFSTIHRLLENPLAPLVMMATNQSLSIGGVPLDFLDRCLVVRTVAYSHEEMARILRKRMMAENLVINEDSFALLVQVCAESSLRYGLSLMSIAYFIAKKAAITIFHVQRAKELFMDQKRSVMLCESLYLHQ